MRILVLICSSIIGFSAIAQDDGLYRDVNITLFNEASGNAIRSDLNIGSV